MQNELGTVDQTADAFSPLSPVLSLNLAEPLSPHRIFNTSVAVESNSSQLFSKSLPQTSSMPQTGTKTIDDNSSNSNSNFSSSSSSLSSISNENEANHQPAEPRIKQKHKINLPKQQQLKSKQTNKCICLNENERLYNCLHCTSNYPICVRRSKDGEETNYKSELVIANNSLNSNSRTNHFNQYNHNNSNFESSSTMASSSSISSSTGKMNLKQSPIPLSSSTLIALLTSNTFIPPPNINLAHFKQNKK